MKFLFILSIAFLLAACVDQKGVLNKFIPKEEDTLARRMIDLLRGGRYEEVKSHLDTSVTGEIDAEILEQIHKLLAHGPILAVERVGCDVRVLAGSEAKRTTNLTYQLHFADEWLLATFVLQSQGGKILVAGLHFQPIRESLEIYNRFTLRERSPLHYIFLSCAILVPIFSLTVLVICCFTPVRRRWLWILFIIVGIGKFQLNWTTGGVGVQLLSIFPFWRRLSPRRSLCPLDAVLFHPRRCHNFSCSEEQTASAKPTARVARGTAFHSSRADLAIVL